jgi:hypothetical protein
MVVLIIVEIFIVSIYLPVRYFLIVAMVVGGQISGYHQPGECGKTFPEKEANTFLFWRFE